MTLNSKYEIPQQIERLWRKGKSFIFNIFAGTSPCFLSDRQTFLFCTQIIELALLLDNADVPGLQTTF